MSNPKYRHIGTPEDRIIEECGEVLQAVIKGTPFDRLVEECGELLQAASKINRFGYYNRHPDGGPTNLEKLCAEWMDLKSAFSNYLDDVLHQAGYQAVFDDIKPEK